MPVMTIHPLFAIEASDVISLMFFIIMLLGWLFQAMAGKKENKKPEGRRDRQVEKEKVDHQIAQFFEEINELQNPEPQAVAKPRPRRRPENDFDIELVEMDDLDILEEEPALAPIRQPQPRRNRPPQNRPQRKKQKPKKPRPAEPLATSEQSIESRKLPESSLGQGLVEHTEQYIAGNEAAKQAHFESLGSGVVQSVSSHLGDSTFQPTSSQKESKSANIREMLSKPENIRQAILLNEVLSKPISIR